MTTSMMHKVLHMVTDCYNKAMMFQSIIEDFCNDYEDTDGLGWSEDADKLLCALEAKRDHYLIAANGSLDIALRDFNIIEEDDEEVNDVLDFDEEDEE